MMAAVFGTDAQVNQLSVPSTWWKFCHHKLSLWMVSLFNAVILCSYEFTVSCSLVHVHLCQVVVDLCLEEQ